MRYLFTKKPILIDCGYVVYIVISNNGVLNSLHHHSFLFKLLSFAVWHVLNVISFHMFFQIKITSKTLQWQPKEVISKKN